ncbi:hypothetical protein EWB00_005068 [Schistosoma japonicum]|uniref:Uncharacterized protein n=2 Tax=Schistosoma japonicum TaxID=6182 RepID=A0A4Z2D3Q3_SCHJA|nr:hypothetical protein EWB00_005068 [Schistosoma japonicum]
MMIRSANGLSQSSPTFNKSNYDNGGQRNTMNSLNVVVVTVPSVSLTNSSTSVIVVSQSTTTTTTTTTTVSSSVFSRNSRNTIGYRCSCKESTSHLSHRSGNYSSGVHYSQHFHHHNNHHHHHSSHKENYTPHATAVVECSNSPTVSGTASSNSLSHYHSPHYSTHHYHHTSTVQQNTKHNSLQNKWKPVISRELQEFMISQWEQFHEQLLHSNSVDAKSCCIATTTATTTTTSATSVITKAPTNITQSSSGDSFTNNNSAFSSSDLTSSRTSLSDNSSSGQVTNVALCNSNSPSAVGTNINGRSRASDLPSTLTTSDITYGVGSSNNSNNSCCGVGVGGCGNYLRRKQSCGYSTNQMTRSMNTGSSTWKRNLTSNRKNSSPGTFSSRCSANYFHNRSSSFVVNTTASNNLPPVTYISSSSLNSTSDQVNTICVNNQRNTKSLNVTDFKNPSATAQSASVISVTSIATSDGYIQQKISPVSSCSTCDSASKVDVCSPNVMNSDDLLKLEIKTENVNKISDTRVESNNCVVNEQHLTDIHLINNNDSSTNSGNGNGNTNDQLKDKRFNMESVNNSCIISSKSLLSDNETLTMPMFKDEEIDCSVNSYGKIEEGECYWTPDPPASPENNATLHGESYSSSYHSSSLSPNSPPRQLSVSLPNSKNLHTIYPNHHPPSPSRHTDLSSMPDFYRCNQSVDSLLISSSNNRLESLNDVD